VDAIYQDIMRIIERICQDPMALNMLHTASIFDWSSPTAVEDAASMLVEIKPYLDTLGLSEVTGHMGASDWLYKLRRQAGKPTFFGVLYQIGPRTLATNIAKTTGEPCDLETAKMLIHQVKHVLFPGLGKMSERMVKSAEKYGYVRNVMGRYRHPVGINSGNHGAIARAKRQSGNAPIQMLVASLMEVVMVAIDTDPVFNHDLKARMLLQIHDEIIGEAPVGHAYEAKARLVHLMETSHGIVTPVKFRASGSVGSNMAELK
jgi:DNA polymerase-1